MQQKGNNNWMAIQTGKPYTPETGKNGILRPWNNLSYLKKCINFSGATYNKEQLNKIKCI